MAIGTVRASGGLQPQLISGQSSQIASEAVGSLGEAVSRLAQTGLGYLKSKEEIAAVYDRRAQASKGLELDTQFLRYQQDSAKEFTEFSRARSASPAGLTRDYDTMLAEREAAFLKTVPPRFQEEMKAKLAQDRAIRVGSAFSQELTLLDTVDTKNLNQGLNTLGSSIKSGGVSLEDAQANWEELVTRSGLSEADKASFIDNGRAILQGLEFSTVIEKNAAGYGAVSDGSSGADVVAAGLLPQERAILNAIAQNEAPAYNMWNGGTSFEGYEDHPAASSKAPGESTAAGRYQFLLGTWREASKSYKRATGIAVPNFSPEWQDRVALHWAEVQFNKYYSGATFREILASGDPQQLVILRDVLGKPRSSNPNDLEWAGLGALGDAAFIEIMTGEKGFAGGGTGSATNPNVWSDPRYADLSLETKMSFANAAADAVKQQQLAMQSELKLQREKFLNDAYNAGYSNQPGALDLLKQSPNWDAEAAAKFNSGQEVFRAAEKSVSTVGNSLAAGHPLSTTEISAFGKWFGEDSFAGIAAGDKASYEKLQWAVGQARLFPEGSVDAFSAALGSRETAPAALAFLASAIAGDTSILSRSGFSKETVAEVQLYKNIASREPNADKAFEKYLMATDVVQTTGKTPTQLTTEASKLFSEAYPTSDKVTDLFDSWFSFAPNTKMNPSLEGQLMVDANAAYLDGYRIYGNAEAADAYMQSSLDTLYGISQTRSSFKYPLLPAGKEVIQDTAVLMRHPPEKYYPTTDGDFGFLYSAISDFAATAGASKDGAVLIPDDVTDKEVRSGALPTYKVLGVGKFGEAVILPGRFGGDALAKRSRDVATEDAKVTNSLSYVDAYNDQLVELQGKLERERNFPTSPEAVEKLISEIDVVERKRQASIASAVEQGYMAPEALTTEPSIYVGNLATEFMSRLDSNEVLSKRLNGLSRAGNPVDAMIMIIAKELRIPKSLATEVANEMQRMNE